MLGTTDTEIASAQSADGIAPESLCHPEKVERAFSDLQSDFERQHDSLTQSQFDRLVFRRMLSPAEMVAVLDRLRAVGIELEDSNVRRGESNDNIRPTEPTNILEAERRANPYSLLKPQEEIDLGRRVQLALRTQADLDPQKLESEGERDIVRRGIAARDRMMVANFRLVRFVIKNLRRPVRSLDSWDMFQEGAMGLMKAIAKFDPELGLRFSTYAMWWIRQGIFRGLDDQDSTIRIPVHRMESIRKMKVLTRRLTIEYGREPRVRELAEALNWPLEKTVFVQRLAQLDCVSMDAPVGSDGDDRTVMDRVASDEPTPFDNARVAQRKDVLTRLLERLSPRERMVIERRFGLGSMDREETLQQVGDDFGVTRERIRQIEEKALRRLRKVVDRRLYEALV